MGEHGNDLSVACGRFASRSRRPKKFRANLIELPVAAFLWTFAAKLRSNVIKLLQFASVAHLVLDVSAHHSSSIFWTQGQRLGFFALRARLVLPGEHFFRNNVRVFTHAAGK